MNERAESAPSALRPSQREQYDERGFLNLGRLLNDDLVQEIRLSIEKFAAESQGEAKYGVLRHNVWQEVECIEELIRDGKLAALARELLGETEVVLFQDNLVWKPPGAARIEWHQDFSYWPLDAPLGVTQWIALDPADEANGCLHYLPGTHLLGERQPADFIERATQSIEGEMLAPRSDLPPLADLPPLDWEPRAHGAVAATARPGDVLVHHPLTWHMSPPNLSTRQRCALSLTWISPTVRWAPDHAPHPYTYQLNPRPNEGVDGEAFLRFSTALEH